MSDVPGRSFIGKPEVKPSLPEQAQDSEKKPEAPETIEQELSRVKEELAFALKANEECITINQEHLKILSEKDKLLHENNKAAIQIKEYLDKEAIKLKNVAIAYHNINHQWNSLNAVRSRLKDLEKDVASPIYGATPKIVPKEKVDLVNGQGENLDGTKRDNIVGRLGAADRLASAIAHDRVVVRKPGGK